jgi:hypothetical protein
MNGMLKWPLILAAIVVVLRVILEQAGAPGTVSNVFSVVLLYLIICPVYFAFRIGGSGVEKPYRTLFKTTALYAVLARLMVIPTYWLAYIFQWTAPRFSTAQGGVVGEGVTPLNGFIIIPAAALALWVIGSVVIGGGIGSIIIALRNRSRRAMAAQAAGRS